MGLSKTGSNTGVTESFKRSLQFHPYKMLVYLMITAISTAFLFLTVSYFFTSIGNNFNHFKLPFIFHANTIIIIASSFTLFQTRKALFQDDTANYLSGLAFTAILGLAFTVFQVLGWVELLKSGVSMQNSVGAAYLYVISGLHLLHLFAGLSLLVWFFVKAMMRRNDAVQLLLFETTPLSKMKIDLLCTFWHFIDLLWIYLYVFFLIMIALNPDN